MIRASPDEGQRCRGFRNVLERCGRNHRPRLLPHLSRADQRRACPWCSRWAITASSGVTEIRLARLVRGRNSGRSQFTRVRPKASVWSEGPKRSLLFRQRRPLTPLENIETLHAGRHRAAKSAANISCRKLRSRSSASLDLASAIAASGVT